jgi:hypothetical protein
LVFSEFFSSLLLQLIASSLSACPINLQRQQRADLPNSIRDGVGYLL